MHVEPPEGRLESAKDFLKHYGMIVLSILTALGLEQGLEAWHRHESGVEAAAQIQHELQANLDEVRHVLAYNEKRSGPLQARVQALSDAIAAGASRETLMETQVRPSLKEFALDFNLPNLEREAWERAVASHAAASIDDERLGKYSAAYAAQRDALPLAWQGFGMMLNGPRMLDAVEDAKLGTVAPVEYLHVLRQYATAVDVAQSSLYDLEASLARAAGAKPMARPGARPASAS